MKVTIRVEPDGSGISVSLTDAEDGSSAAEAKSSPAVAPGVIVVGPIVINVAGLASSANDAGKRAGGGASENPRGGTVPPGSIGGGGTVPPGSIGSGPGSGNGSGPRTIVIGPIVTDCSSTAQTASNPLSKDGGKSGDPVTIAQKGSYSGLKQEYDKWCWAAVATSIARYFTPGTAWTQCKVASKVMGASRKCCDDPEGCNEPNSLEDALRHIQHFRETKPTRSFAELEADLAMGPVCVFIAWKGGGGHFAVIWKCRRSPSGVEQVYVADPFFADSLVNYDQFLTKYQSATQPGGGSWQETYFVQR